MKSFGFFKRGFSLIVALLVMLALSVPAFADDGGSSGSSNSGGSNGSGRKDKDKGKHGGDDGDHGGHGGGHDGSGTNGGNGGSGGQGGQGGAGGSASSSTSSSSSSTSSSTSNQSMTGNYSGFETVNVDNPLQAPSVFLPNLSPTAPCIVGMTIGGSVPGGSLGFGKGTKDHNCEGMEMSRVLHGQGYIRMGLLAICDTPYMKDHKDLRADCLEQAKKAPEFVQAAQPQTPAAAPPVIVQVPTPVPAPAPPAPAAQPQPDPKPAQRILLGDCTFLNTERHVTPACKARLDLIKPRLDAGITTLEFTGRLADNWAWCMKQRLMDDGVLKEHIVITANHDHENRRNSVFVYLTPTQ